MAQNFTSITDLIKKHQEQSAVSKPKESEPIARISENTTIKEVGEHQIDKEVKPFITVKSESIKLPPDLKKLGLVAKETTQYPSYTNIKTPLADDKVLPGLHAPLNSSMRWLATLTMYILARAHITLKKVHGHVVRVIKQ